MPVLSMLVPPRPRITPSMIFSSNVLSSSSSSPARAACEVISSPTPSAIADSRIARVSALAELLSPEMPVSVLRMTCPARSLSAQTNPRPQTLTTAATGPLRVVSAGNQGAFAAGTTGAPFSEVRAPPMSPFYELRKQRGTGITIQVRPSISSSCPNSRQCLRNSKLAVLARNHTIGPQRRQQSPHRRG